jgi:diacylglycerol kinase family enzyme
VNPRATMSGRPGPIHFILNGSSGASADLASLESLIREHAREAGRDVQVVPCASGDELRRAVQQGRDAGAAAVVAGGGDGTVNSVAAGLVGSDVPLGVLPLGTLNHFAKDLGLPLDHAAAVDVIFRGQVRSIDAGEVNGRLFLNNSSFGLYARIVQLRHRHPARGIAKWPIAAWAMFKVLERNPTFTVRIDADGAACEYRTPLVMVANNAYRMAGFDAGSRESLSGGSLAVYVVKTSGKLELAKLVWRIMAGSASNEELDVHVVPEAVIETNAGRMAVAFDGEVEPFDMPLKYRIRTGELKVLVPG